MRYVYFLQLCHSGIYAGSVNDLRCRVDSHKRGHVDSTKTHLPIASGSGKAFANKRLW